MRCGYCFFLLLLSGILCAEAQNYPGTNPPNTTPPTVPQTEQTAPDDRTVQSRGSLTSPEVEKLIQQRLRSEPTLANTKVSAQASDGSITMTGKVRDEKQHQMALLIAKSYAGERELIDQITVAGSE